MVWGSLSEEDHDLFLAEHIIVKEAGGRRQSCHYLCAALHKINPRYQLVFSRKVLEVWKAEEPVHQAPACPLEVAFALVAAALAIEQYGIAISILLCFSGLLRISEALQLTRADLVFTEGVLVLLLGRTKRGIDQKVVLTHPDVVAWVRQYLQVFEGAADKLVCNVSYAKVRYWLPRLCKKLGLTNLALTSHSFRRGGASTEGCLCRTLRYKGVGRLNLHVGNTFVVGNSSCFGFKPRSDPQSGAPFSCWPSLYFFCCLQKRALALQGRWKS